MGRMAPVLWLLILTGCAAEQPPQPPLPPSAVPGPAQVTSAARPPIAPAPPPLRGYVEEVDELFRALAERDARAGGTLGTATGTGSQSLTAASIPRVSRPDPTPGAGAAYEENLEVCLDGRFPAFCDHERLTAQDGARVQKAEYEANLITCIDPQWQHLCRPELLPRRRLRADRRAARGSSRHAPAIPAGRGSPPTSSPVGRSKARAGRARARPAGRR